MRRMPPLPYVGMPNILAGERLVPELLQDDATPAALSAALLALWRDKPARERQLARFREFHELLRQNTAQKAAEAILGVGREKPARERRLARFRESHELLRQNTAQKAAEAILGVLQERGVREKRHG